MFLSGMCCDVITVINVDTSFENLVLHFRFLSVLFKSQNLFRILKTRKQNF